MQAKPSLALSAQKAQKQVAPDFIRKIAGSTNFMQTMQPIPATALHS